MKRAQTVATVGSLLLAGLVGGGCGGAGSALGDKPTVAGTVEGWMKGTGYNVTVRLSKSKNPVATLGTGILDASGTFSLTLPGSDVVTPQLSEPEPIADDGCKAQPTVTPSNLRYASLVLVAQKTGAPIEYVSLGTPTTKDSKPKPGDVAVEYMYSDQDGSIVGEADCGEGTSVVKGTFNVHLSKGWNLFITKIQEYDFSPSGIRIISDVATGQVPAGVKWQVRQSTLTPES